MKAIERFECEVCHKIYPNMKAAEKCEEMHLKPTEILNVTFATCNPALSVYMADGNEPVADYPEAIKVKFENGATRTYFRRGCD